MFEAYGDGLAAVGGRSAAEADQQIAARLTRGIGAVHHRLARRVGRHLIPTPRITLTQGRRHGLDGVGFTVQGAADQQKYPFGAQPFGFPGHRPGRRLAKNHPVHAREDNLPALHSIHPF